MKATYYVFKIMKKTIINVSKFFLSWFLCVLFSSCGGSDDSLAEGLSSGEAFAVQSCGLKVIADSGGDSSGSGASGQKWSTPALESESSWSIDTPIKEIIYLRDTLNEAAVNASAAAQEENTFMTLAESTNAMASFVSQVVASLQENPWYRDNPLFTDGDALYNSPRKTRLSACAALSLRLNSGL